MISVTVAKDLNPLHWTRHSVDAICPFLKEQFAVWPKTARIYHKHVSQDCDVTPTNDTEADRLETLEGPFFVVVTPELPLWAIIAIIAVVAVIAAAFLLLPKTPNVSQKNPSSPNNSLSDRQNQMRINGRIPDIVGTVRSTPDLIEIPYRIFVGNIENEICYMCVGRGDYDISDIRNDTTLLNTIMGEACAVYAPFTSPNSGAAPVQQIGVDIDQPVSNVKKISGVNGQTLFPPNYNLLNGTEDAYIQYCLFGDGTYGLQSNDSSIKMNGRWELGDTLNITDGTFTSGGFNFNPTGVYTCVYVDEVKLVFQDPTISNPDWLNLVHFSGGHTAASSPVIDTNPNVDGWTQAVVVQITDAGQLLCNVVALAGAYNMYKETQYAVTVSFQFGVTPLNDDGTTNGPEQIFSGSLRGSSVSRNAVGSTTYIPFTTTGQISIRAKRTSNTDKDLHVSAVDQIQWRDLYVMSTNQPHDFGNVTTIQTRTIATPQALAQQERKLNMLATRKVPIRISGTTYGPAAATNSADDILVFLATDPFIGRRTLAELDLDGIYSTVATVKTLFGTSEAGEFCYTFDDPDMSYEETVASLAIAVFCTAYRQGSVMTLYFEQQTSSSAVLFNHRNKVPGSETRTTTFGYQDNFDGVKYNWIDPNNYDQPATIYIPPDQSAKNPKEVTSVGVRNTLQAHFGAYRVFNKLVFQNTTTEFDATKQADVLVISQRIASTDNTRPDVQDGEVIGQNVLELTLSQNVVFKVGQTYTIFLQHYDATVESISITVGSAANKVVLAIAPRLTLAIGSALYRPAAYEIVGSSEDGAQPFLLTQKEPNDDATVKVSAINYDDRYYQNDLDYVNGYIDAGGVFTDAGIVAGVSPVGGGGTPSTSFLDRWLWF